MGIFTALYKVVKLALFQFKYRGSQEKPTVERVKEETWWHPLVSGGCAGMASVYCMDPSWHRTMALYMATRAVQCFYNFAKTRDYWHFWGSDWPHGDSLLFIVSSAQIMYAYVMRPETLPPSYYRFIRTQGPLPEVVLQAVRTQCRDLPVNTGELFEYVAKEGGEEVLNIVKVGFVCMLSV